MGAAQPLRVRFDAFELDEAGARLTRNGQPVPLPRKAFGVLCALARQPGELLTKTALLDAVWGHQYVTESVLKTTISELRAALADDAKRPRYIETASRHGYRFIGRCLAIDAAAARVTPSIALETGIIGRDAALERLRRCWQIVSDGRNRLVWIIGEAGVGKTTLIERFAAEIDPQLTTYGQCIEQIGGSEPHLPVLQGLKLLCRRDPQLPAMMRQIAPTWLLQMPWLMSETERAALHGELAGVHQDRMVRELQALMDRFTEAHPVLFVVEDLHWADAGTLRIMENFVRIRDPHRVMWLCSLRMQHVLAQEDHPLRVLRQELPAHKVYEEILLDRFSPGEVATYVESRLPAANVPAAFAHRLYAHTGGLPLFVANVMDTLTGQGVADPAAMEAWLNAPPDAPLPVPDSLSGAIERQLARLPADVQAVVEAASVCGMEFRADTVADLVQQDASWVREQCDRLVRQQCWLRHVGIVDLADGAFDTRYAFLHAIYRHVFQQRIAMPQRVQYHRRAAQSLATRTAPGERVSLVDIGAHHEHGQQFNAAVRRYAEAATGDVTRFAPHAALEVITHALTLLPRCPSGLERSELELQLSSVRGVACSQVYGLGSPEALAEFERTRTLCDALPQTPARALLLHGLAQSLCVRGAYAESRELVERVLALAEEYDDDLLRVCGASVLGMIHAVRGDHAAAREWLERGIALCERNVDRFPPGAFFIDQLVLMRCNLVMALSHLACMREAQRQLESAIERAQRIGQPSASMLTYWVGALAAVRREAAEDVERQATALRELVDRALLMQGAGAARWILGWAKAHRGAPRDGLALILEGYEWHARLGMFAGTSEALSYAAEAELLAGERAAARERLATALELVERIGERCEVPNLHLLRARLCAAQGDAQGARTARVEALAEARAQHALYYEVKALVALCDSADRTADDLHALRAACERLPDGWDTPVPFVQRAGALLRG